MCELCDIIKEDEQYKEMMRKMKIEDEKRKEGTKQLSAQYEWMKKLNYTDETNIPLDEIVLFEWRMPHSNANSFYQPLRLNYMETPSFFSHGSTRSLLFYSERVILLSKQTGVERGIAHFKHHLQASFQFSELNIKDDEKTLRISFNGEKELVNITTNEKETVHIEFKFVHVKLKPNMIKETKHQIVHIGNIGFGKSPHQGQYMKPRINLIARFDIPANHLALHPYAEEACERAGKDLKDIQTNIHHYFLQHFK